MAVTAVQSGVTRTYRCLNYQYATGATSVAQYVTLNCVLTLKNLDTITILAIEGITGSLTIGAPAGDGPGVTAANYQQRIQIVKLGPTYGRRNSASVSASSAVSQTAIAFDTDDTTTSYSTTCLTYAAGVFTTKCSAQYLVSVQTVWGCANDGDAVMWLVATLSGVTTSRQVVSGYCSSTAANQGSILVDSFSMNAGDSFSIGVRTTTAGSANTYGDASFATSGYVSAIQISEFPATN